MRPQSHELTVAVLDQPRFDREGMVAFTSLRSPSSTGSTSANPLHESTGNITATLRDRLGNVRHRIGPHVREIGTYAIGHPLLIVRHGSCRGDRTDG